MVKMLLESAGTYGFGGGVSEAALRKYTAEYGEQLIAMETLTEQHEVFESTFYDIEVAEFNAMMESYGTGSDPVMESIGGKISAGITKIKDLIQKLWKKVKVFCYNIKRFLDGVFLDGQDFVKRYKNDFNDLKLTGFTYDMYKFTINFDIAGCVEVAGGHVKKYEDTEKWSTMGKNEVNGTPKGGVATKVDGNIQDYSTKDNGEIDESPTLTDADRERILAEVAENAGCKNASISDVDELKKEVWSAMRDDATYGDAPKSEDVTSVSEYVTVLETSRKDLTNYDRLANKVDSLYSQTLKKLTAIEKAIPKGYEGNEIMKKKALSQCRLMYATLSFTQTAVNAVVAETRGAYVERNKQYKGMLLKALSYKEPKKN